MLISTCIALQGSFSASHFETDTTIPFASRVILLGVVPAGTVQGAHRFQRNVLAFGGWR